MFYCDPNSRYCYAVSFDDDMTVSTNAFNNTATDPSRPEVVSLRPEDVPLRAGPPTREELLVHYPAKFTWEQLKTFVNSGCVTVIVVYTQTIVLSRSIFTATSDC